MNQHKTNILDEVNEWKHISLQQSSVINKYVPLFCSKMRIMMIMIKIMEIMKNNGIYENNKLVE